MLILIAPVIPLLGIYPNQIFFFNIYKKNLIKVLLTILAMTRSSPSSWVTSCVALGFLGESARDFADSQIWPHKFIWNCVSLVANNNVLHYSILVILFLPPSEGEIYIFILWSVLGHMACFSLCNINKYESILKNNWEMLACEFCFLFLHFKPWDHHELNLAC